MRQYSKDTFSIIFRERVFSLLEDGYMAIVTTDTDDLKFCKLRHRTNGKEVILKGYPKTKVIEQTTNGLLKFVGVYDGSRKP